MIRLLYLLLLFTAMPLGLFARQDLRVSALEARVSTLESKVRQAGEAGAAAFLFGAFCALWAQNTGRSAWLWFFLGLLFSVITVVVLLYKNANDRSQNPLRKRFDLEDFRQQ